jgi:hypothetical protein
MVRARAHLAADVDAQHILHTWSLLLVCRLDSRGLHTQMRRCIEGQRASCVIRYQGDCCTRTNLGLLATAQTCCGPQHAPIMSQAAGNSSCQQNTCTSGERLGRSAFIDERSNHLHRHPTFWLASLMVDQQPCEEDWILGLPYCQQ